MCLGIPAKIIEITSGPLPHAVLDFAGQNRACSLAYVPEAQVGDYVLIQNGFAMSIMDEASALESLATIEEFNLIQRDL
ncbi:HypC/HybG/HupF family hydrogenase formation chaperone [Corynebacterium canis]|uniref:HypC/HybG/HupF family hydrogenase formation chaperone n=1 Tax=Corynebacterium canis TaxID=679663 RepID=A0A5C5UN60_9CORY|nr:HypC/HybG/HupF family hydrogenase formation chaperone [Corynebacterium canis]TWT26805.1 HypC/HybG/HupF family hydrogenase formation chaperone [Corynebacterium canis]WJY74482.1 Hydrogenase isoenzymes formation protein HypC [Corynebacterium canis]